MILLKRLITVVTIIGLFSIVGCKKDDDKANQEPTCTITSPTTGQEIIQGDTIIISVEAQDSDGTIAEVLFSINGVEKGSVTSVPYNYSWNTSDESISEHLLKATAIDNSGGSTSSEVTVEIGGIPAANFSATQTSGSAPLIVQFNDESENNPTSYQWDFGDGNTSTQQNPSHTYNDNGAYTVTLTTTNNYGSDTETKTDYIVVGTFTDPRDGQTYNIVTIGTQIWFAENLNYQATLGSSWYNNSSANGDIYGRLYIWNAAIIVCPIGWHLPSDDEWKTLEMFLGMSQSDADKREWGRGTNEGEKLKSTSGWVSGGNGTDTVGFTALPGGHYYYGIGEFWSLGTYGFWWTATGINSTYAVGRALNYSDSGVARLHLDKYDEFSVRCIKD